MGFVVFQPRRIFAPNGTFSGLPLALETLGGNRWGSPVHRIRRSVVVVSLVRRAVSPSEDTGEARKRLVVVESPAKAKTITRLLEGRGYVVESSVGHVRDLASKKQQLPEALKSASWGPLGVDVESGQFTPIYVFIEGKRKIVSQIKKQMEDVSELILATDGDREGEAISWHLLETLRPGSNVTVKRAVFHEITRDAILESFENSSNSLNMDLVRAQETRRIVDRLAGFTMSPLLWKKIARGLSAGRVQSVAMDMIVRREHERFSFVQGSYFGVEAEFETDPPFSAELTHLAQRRVAGGKDLDDATGTLSQEAQERGVFHLRENDADSLVYTLSSLDKKMEVVKVERKRRRMKSPAPFITSTLQQEASRRLGVSASSVMKIAQSLYEQGFITYMRTDNPFLSGNSTKAAREAIVKEFGTHLLGSSDDFAPKKPPKNAQEAHEAIRPAGEVFVNPKDVGLSDIELKLYTLIYRRTLASQMRCAELDITSVTLGIGDAIFRASGTTVVSLGFLLAYETDYTEESGDSRGRILPELSESQKISVKTLVGKKHETKPPARYTDASLVKQLESCGVGRPSTYATIIETLVDRKYVFRLDSSRSLAPSFTAFAVDRLLLQYCPSFVDPSFTAQMEEALDTIASGNGDRIEYLRNYYYGDHGLLNTVKRVELEAHSADLRRVELPSLQELGNSVALFVGPFGTYVEDHSTGLRASVPRNVLPSDLDAHQVRDILTRAENPTLGQDPQSGLPVLLKIGRFGPYLQLGEEEPNSTQKPKRAALLPGMDVGTVDLQSALNLLQLPRLVAVHPRTGLEIRAGIGRFGPFLMHDDKFLSVPKSDDIFTLTAERATAIVTDAEEKELARGDEVLGQHDGKAVRLVRGKFGPYLRVGRRSVALPTSLKKSTSIKFDDVIDLLEASLSSKSKEKRKGSEKQTTALSKDDKPPPGDSKVPRKRRTRKSSELV
eukprot:CAMPEP_0184678518 /NCGR_PEP_ID=MMETSP0312-20130426/1270_1 /TAXON_ID=31354 /ORGANISM="Compsopogon coeruleus, Strain SAG 36.94" /LENGTH=955 /DNA_ID=CAMNT_0027127325 /DNA_START=39 /DNA_END=2906 /DNA_ORIENTATION=-